LLQNGEPPPPLQHPGNNVDLEHHDAPLALGTLADGRVVIALTRFDALGPSFGRVPLGLTTPRWPQLWERLAAAMPSCSTAAFPGSCCSEMPAVTPEAGLASAACRSG